MAMRKIVPLILVGLLAAVFSFAEGQAERQSGADKVTVTGKVYLQNRLHPELQSGGQQYLLMVPRRLTWNLDIKEGEQVTVEGYKVPGPRYGSAPEAVYLRVTQASIQGKTYNVDDYFGGRGFSGRMMGWGGSRAGRFGYGPCDGGGPGPRGGWGPQS